MDSKPLDGAFTPAVDGVYRVVATVEAIRTPLGRIVEFFLDLAIDAARIRSAYRQELYGATLWLYGEGGEDGVRIVRGELEESEIQQILDHEYRMEELYHKQSDSIVRNVAAVAAEFMRSAGAHVFADAVSKLRWAHSGSKEPQA